MVAEAAAGTNSSSQDKKSPQSFEAAGFCFFMMLPAFKVPGAFALL
jgi:hypothetical protein